MRPFDHERMQVYRTSLRFVTHCETLLSPAPKGRGYLTDQLRRAALSVVANVAEGAGEFAPREKRRFYRIARRSATECAALLDVGVRLGLFEPDTFAKGRRMLAQIVAMLVALTKT